MLDLNNLIAPSSGWILNTANGINDAGQIVGNGTINGYTRGFLLTPALPGDANLDGVVDINDLSKVLTNYDKTGMQWADGDFTGDGTVDINDLGNVLANYDKSAGLSSAGIKAVPEPSSLAVPQRRCHQPANLRVAPFGATRWQSPERCAGLRDRLGHRPANGR